MLYRFDQFELDDKLYELRRRGAGITVSRKAFDVLLYLVCHSERVVSKGELLEHCWPGEVVSETVLPTNISWLRKALGDETAGSRFIKTVRGRGYRFISPVTKVEAEADGRPPGGAGAPERSDPFVGRERSLALLGGRLEEALSARGQLVFLLGEPGIGKTRIAEELAGQARSRGAKVLAGRGYEGEGAPAFWPWIQVLRQAMDDAAELAACAPGVACLLPQAQGEMPSLPSQALDSAPARFRLFDGIASLLVRISRRRPLVVILDDLQCADPPSLRLLQFVARELRNASIFLVGAYRDTEIERRHPLSPVLGDLLHDPHVSSLRLVGLSEPEVRRFLAGALGREPPAALGHAVYERTEGNPFFVREMVRLLTTEGRFDDPATTDVRSLPLPQSVRDVVRCRLTRLSEGCNRVLRRAAVIGRELSLNVLRRLPVPPGDDLLALLDEAVAAGILTDDARTIDRAGPLRLGHFAFTHTLIRETLYEDLTGPQKTRLHRQVATALEGLHELGSDEAPLSELAYHFFRAAPGGEAERAIVYCTRAAQRAVEVLAYEEAVAHYERALQALELVVPGDESRRAELLGALGRARRKAAGDGSEPSA